MKPQNTIFLGVLLFLGICGIVFAGIGTLLSFFIIFCLVVLGVYFHSIDAQDRHEALQREVRHEQEEQEAQLWLHQTFVPHTHDYLKEHIRKVILVSGILLLFFTFAWSFLLSGLTSALLNVLFMGIFFVIFVYYMTHAPKRLSHLSKRLPKSVRHYLRNEWIRAYFLLLPITSLAVFLMAYINNRGYIGVHIFSIPLFIFFYTLFFVCLFCFRQYYEESQREEEKEIKKMLKD